MDNNVNKIRKPGSKMMESFKTAANPFYATGYGISLNNINFWQKNVELQFIVVWAGGSSFTFTGTDARSILYSLGDVDNQKFNELTPEGQAKLNEYFNPPTPTPAEDTPIN